MMMMMEGPRALGKEDDGVGLRNNRSNWNMRWDAEAMSSGGS